jgi:hypothetical protein
VRVKELLHGTVTARLNFIMPVAVPEPVEAIALSVVLGEAE